MALKSLEFKSMSFISLLLSPPSERLFRQMADLLVSDGYHAAGYTYINVDDCWLDHRKVLLSAITVSPNHEVT